MPALICLSPSSPAAEDRTISTTQKQNSIFMDMKRKKHRLANWDEGIGLLDPGSESELADRNLFPTNFPIYEVNVSTTYIPVK